jgi:hypothetical protein
MPLQHGAVARLELPFRGRCALLEEGDVLVFFLEEVTPLEPPATAWYRGLCAAAAAAEEAGRVTHGPALAPNLEVLAELHERYVAAATAHGAADLAADGPRAVAMASMQRLHSELYWWWVLVRVRVRVSCLTLILSPNPDPNPRPTNPNPNPNQVGARQERGRPRWLAPPPGQPADRAGGSALRLGHAARGLRGGAARAVVPRPRAPQPQP